MRIFYIHLKYFLFVNINNSIAWMCPNLLISLKSFYVCADTHFWRLTYRRHDRCSRLHISGCFLGLGVIRAKFNDKFGLILGITSGGSRVFWNYSLPFVFSRVPKKFFAENGSLPPGDFPRLGKWEYMPNKGNDPHIQHLPMY